MEEMAMAHSSERGRPRKVLVIYGKYPRPGSVKTRLVPPFSHDEASDLYRSFLHDLLHRTKSLPGVQTILSISDVEDLHSMRALLETWSQPERNTPVSLTHQVSGDLGRRFLGTIESCTRLAQSNVLILGSDHPTVPITYLEEGFRALSEHDIVVGPAEDGGFYTVGMKREHKGLFEGLSWSTDRIYHELLERCRIAGLSVHQLPAWYDVDRPVDVRRLLTEVAQSSEYEMIARLSGLLEDVLDRSDLSDSLHTEEKGE